VRQRNISISAAALALAAVSLTGSIPAGASATHSVRIKDIDFSPSTITVRRGDVVRWAWLDGSTPHNVRSRGALRFRGSPTKTQGTYSVRFRRSGTYRYVCTIHFNMKAKVVVR
jgi:plastocyanin